MHVSKLLWPGGAPSFKGVMVGNPLTYMPYRDYGFYGTAWGHQLLPKTLWDEYIQNGCAMADPEPEACYEITSRMHQILYGLDPYALDFPNCNLAEVHANCSIKPGSGLGTMH